MLFFVWTWRWPLVGDASLIHYIGFLIERGWAPYRDLGDMNMPGAFLVELGAMHLFGMGDLAWRIFDFSLLAGASAAFFSILGRKNWLAALFASSLFILIHGRDGLAQGGQRDLTMAVCLIAATAYLLKSLIGPGGRWFAAAFGLLSGVAATIKPTTALFTLAQILLAAHVLRQAHISDPAQIAFPHSNNRARYIISAAMGYVIAPAISLGFLLREHALAAFLAGLHGIVPYYASLGHRPLSYILLHSLSPILSLAVLWIAVLALDRPTLLHPRLDVTRAALLLGVLFGLINCIVQARALPYYRYPLLTFLLPLMALDFTRALEARPRANLRTADLGADSSPPLRTRAASLLAIAALVVGAFFLAPQSAILIHRYRWQQTDFITSLEQNLNALGGQRLSGHIQCIDSVSGCGTVLYRMRLEPATGVLSDFLLFGPPPGSADVPVVMQTRRQFIAQVDAHLPEIIVVTSHLHIDGPDNYRKLDRWPALTALLAANYTLQTEWTPARTNRWWSREEFPAGYRIYVLRRGPP